MSARSDNVQWFRAAARLTGRILSALTFLALAAAVAVFALRVVTPKPRLAPVVPFEGYTIDVMQAAVTPEKVKAEHDRIVALGPRFLGQPGFYKTEEYIRNRFREAGLDVYEQTNRTAAPRTLRREIYVEETGTAVTGFRKLDDVEIFPFWPNHMQPMVTPREGLVGELVLITTETLKTRDRFRDCIGLIDSRDTQVPESCGFDWASYAALGLSAIVISSPDGLAAMPWSRIVGDSGNPSGGFINGSVPVNYVRLAATPGIFAYVGRHIRLHVETKWENVPNTSIFGILRAPAPARDAVLIASSYDACAILPDRAPGVLQAFEPAIQLCLLDGLLRYRNSIKRDVVFVAFPGRIMSEDGAKNLLRVLGTSQAGTQENRLLAAFGIGVGADKLESRGRARLETRLNPLETRLKQNERRLEMLRVISAAFDAPAFFDDTLESAATVGRFDAATRAFFDEQYRYVLNTLVLQRSEDTLQAKLAFKRDPARDLNGQGFKTYLAVKRKYDEAQSAAGYGMENFLRNKHDYAAEYDVRGRMLELVEELLAYHNERKRGLEQDIALAKALNPYDEVVIVQPGLVPAFDTNAAQETVSFGGGSYLIQSPERVFESLLASARKRVGIESILNVPKVDRWHDAAVWREIGKSPYGFPEIFRDFGYQSFRLVNFGRSESYDCYSVPADSAFMHAVDSMRHSLSLTGEVALSMAHGVAKFPAITGSKYDFKGRVLVSNVGQSIVPSYPLKNALLGTRSRLNPQQFAAPGYYDIPFAFADVYGEFDFFNSEAGSRAFVNLQLSKDDGVGFSPIACGYGADGLIAYMKDEGEDGQRLYKSTGLLWNDTGKFKDLTIVTFRGAPVTILDLENPQTGDLYGWVELVDRDGLTPLRKQCVFTVKTPFVSFIEPDKRIFVELQAGSAQNKLALVTRAFMLGPTSPNVVDPQKEIDGAGYLAADTPIVRDVPVEVSESMVFLNGKRLDLQNRHAMADKRVNAYHQKGVALVDSSHESGKPLHAARLEARDAVTYNELNHPVLRRSVTEAVIGILWYLGLLVPFCFFFEKLVFGFADVRKQIVAQGVTFVVVFALLRLLHPAFEMVQSSLMILLGFVIILISGGITILFSARFKENLEGFRRRQGKVSAAQINVMGVLGTAFLLGLNNMHRRPVRTGLTCGTLVLMTFVMICFTSVQTDVVEETIAITKAPYQGILVKKKDFEPLYSMAGILNEYRGRYDLCEREMYVGEQYLGQSYNSTLEIAFEPAGGPARSLRFDSIVKLAAAEPLQHNIKFLTTRNWFTPDQERDSDDVCPVMLPDAMARKLGIAAENVERGGCVVRINGRRFAVQGIFDAESYNNLRDLDGLTVLPFDLKAMANVASLKNNVILANDSDPRISAGNIVICPARRNLQIQLQYGKPQRQSMVIAMPNATYKQAKAEIDSYLERKAEPVFYGLGGVAFRGKRTRETSIAGMLDLLLPLTIAGLTVLNTMKGSVYERRDEIFVYNAVGIAPRYVFFMFFAEAVVYAVVGSVLGYLFSQGVGRVLTTLHFTGGMNMTFTSITTIYASLAIAAAVFLSTYFPARSAMQIAAPAEESGWRLPEPDGDLLRFRLPFTFNSNDRIAILAFFDRYLQDHGEGSAARFFAAPPRMGISDQLDALADGAYIPRISTTVWLKPFDLAVSQEMTLAVPTDQETGEFIAEIALKRLSGTRESWLRLNVSFVRLVRRHLLHWRAVSDEERREMFAEGRRILETQLTT